MVRRWSRFVFLLATIVALAWTLPTGSARSAVPGPTVREAPVGVHDFPFTLGCCYYDFADVGYELHEYLVSGRAKTYGPSPTTAPFTTRIVVARPTDPARFNGTVVAEWENVTSQMPAEPGMVWLHNHLLPRGYGYVAVNAQAVGVRFLQTWDPLRYAALVHPGDDYSYDIFSQAVAAIRAKPGAGRPMASLKTKQVIGYGQSQSAGRLNDYVNLAQNDAGVLDAVVIQADGGDRKSFPDLRIPLVHFETEDAIVATPPDPRNDPELYRLWEVVGTAHVGNEETQSPGAPTLPLGLTIGTTIPWELDDRYWEHSHYGEEGPGVGATCVGGIELPMRYALNTAIEQLHQWLRGGPPAVQPPRARFDAAGTLLRDEHGNALGGLRLPPMDVPVATYNATACGLLGQTVPFTPERLLALYPTHDEYVAQMRAAIEAAVAGRILLPSDAAQLLRKVERSAIPLWKPSTQYGVEPTP
jgi:hypothetical protein